MMQSPLSEDFLRLLVVFVLIGANGFFVAAEYALVSARPTRLENMAERGNGLARLVLRFKQDPNRFISGTQLGITMMSLALGWVGEDTMAHLLERLLSPIPFLGGGPSGGRAIGALLAAHSIAVPLAFFFITLFHIVLGEQVPKLIALQRAEATAVFAVQPMRLWAKLLRPFIVLLAWSTNSVLHLLGMRYMAGEAASHSPEELKLLLSTSEALDETEQDIAERAVEFGELAVRQVMVPRTEIEALETGTTLAALLEATVRTGHHRFPVYDTSLDHIVGLVHVREALASLLRTGDGRTIEGRLRDLHVEHVMREAITVPETLSVTQLMGLMRRRRQRAAVVVDEYGGTAGLATWEDILERVVGEVPDEFEVEEPEIQPDPRGGHLVDGRTLIEDVNDHFNLNIEAEGYDTIGGFVFGQLGRKAEVGDEIEASGYRFRVEEIDGLRIATVRLEPLDVPATQKPAAAARESAE